MGSLKPVVIVGRQPLFRLGVRQVLSQIGRGGSVSQCSALDELADQEGVSPELLIICRDLYRHFSLSALTNFTQRHPRCSVLVLTEVLGIEERQLMTEGIVARYLPMAVSCRQLGCIVQQLLGDEQPVVTGFADEDLFLPDPNDFTRRERECLQHIQAGHSNKMIAYHFGVSENCVKHHLTSIFHKTKFRNRTDMAVAAQQLVAAFGI